MALDLHPAPQVDPVVRCYRQAYAGSVQRVGIDPADIDLVVITHGHLDQSEALVRSGSTPFLAAGTSSLTTELR